MDLINYNYNIKLHMSNTIHDLKKTTSGPSTLLFNILDNSSKIILEDNTFSLELNNDLIFNISDTKITFLTKLTVENCTFNNIDTNLIICNNIITNNYCVNNINFAKNPEKIGIPAIDKSEAVNTNAKIGFVFAKKLRSVIYLIRDVE